MENTKLTQTIQEITNKKELRGIKKEITQEIIEEYLKKNPDRKKKLEEKNYNKKTKEYEELKKHTRKKLREIHGVFQKNKPSTNKKKKYLEKEEFEFETQETQKLLKTHRSTKERIQNYKKIYEEIQRKKPIKKITDLGCGLNPITYTLLKNLEECYCTDINEEEIQFLNEYFKKTKYKGQAETLDLTKKENHKRIKEKTTNTDTTMLLKIIDSLETIKKGTTKELLKNIKSKQIIISLPNKTISGKNITSQRTWFKKILNERDNQNITIIKTNNEDYYILEN